MDYQFDNVKLFFAFPKKKKSHHLNCHAKFKYAKFQNPWKYKGPQTCQFIQRNICHGTVLAPCHMFFFENVRVPHFHAFVRNSYETLHE